MYVKKASVTSGYMLSFLVKHISYSVHGQNVVMSDLLYVTFLCKYDPLLKSTSFTSPVPSPKAVDLIIYLHRFVTL